MLILHIRHQVLDLLALRLPEAPEAICSHRISVLNGLQGCPECHCRGLAGPTHDLPAISKQCRTPSTVQNCRADCSRLLTRGRSQALSQRSKFREKWFLTAISKLLASQVTDCPMPSRLTSGTQLALRDLQQ